MQKWWDSDDPRVVEIRDNLEDILDQAIDEKRAELEGEIKTAMLELEMAKALKEVELEIRLEEIRAKVESIKRKLRAFSESKEIET